MLAAIGRNQGDITRKSCRGRRRGIGSLREGQRRQQRQAYENFGSGRIFHGVSEQKTNGKTDLLRAAR